MKKVSLFAVILSTTAASGAFAQTATGTAPATCPKAFQGFHFGGNIGYAVGVGNFHARRTTAAGDTGATKHKIGLNGVDGGIGVGYTRRFGLWALGIAFDANWSGAKGTHRDFLRTAAGARFGQHSSLRIKNTLDLYARFGYVIGGQAMPFIKLGWQNAGVKHKTHLAAATTATGPVTRTAFHKTKRLNGLLWGLGVDFLASTHFTVGFEYTGSALSNLGHHHNNTTAGNRHFSFRPQYNKFALTAKIVY